MFTLRHVSGEQCDVLLCRPTVGQARGWVVEDELLKNQVFWGVYAVSIGKYLAMFWRC